MAKGFGKFLLGALVAGAAAAGVWYVLKSNETLDDFDDFDDEVNDDLEDFLKEEAENSEREYVPLDLSKEKKAEEGEKIIGEVEKDKDKVLKEADEKQSGAKEFKFTDLSENKDNKDNKDNKNSKAEAEKKEDSKENK